MISRREEASGPLPEGDFDRRSIYDAVKRVWGFDELRSLQEDAIAAGIAQRDSLVVLPTGGGKSLCYQVPPLVCGRTDIVVSPLIALMKDQADSLAACGYPATAIHSGMSREEQREAEQFLASGDCRLALVSPERLLTPWFLNFVERSGIRSFAIDEAHCVSHWGHDFRPEYRQIAELRQRLDSVSFHAYTATATDRVREDIIEQLGLVDPQVLVGCFDRANLTYRVVPRNDAKSQVIEVLDRHHDEGTIIYCISRKDTERLAQYLAERGYDAECYHAGMETAERRRVQDAFIHDRLKIVVATIAFGMGIDRSDVRAVIHYGCPKSLEHYQQETGRAGRDGLDSECVLIYSAADVLRWKQLLERVQGEYGSDESVLQANYALLDQMRRYAAPVHCRHKTLSEYFGQAYERENCGACDVCLDENDDFVDGTVDAQKILSCIARVRERFGSGHVADVLRGVDNDRIRNAGHDELSTYGLMQELPKNTISNLIIQLLDQDLVDRTPGQYPVLRLNERSWEVMRGQRDVKLLPVRKRKRARVVDDETKWDGVDRDLFDSLRELRTELAREKSVPPYVIFSDASLRDMAKRRPQNEREFLEVHGVGEAKLRNLGPRFLELLVGAQ